MLADFSRPEQAAIALEDAFERLQGDGLSIREQLIREAGDYAWDRVARRYIELYEETLHPSKTQLQSLRQRGQVA
jgi:alpha-1,3-mannosyltransferase